MGPPTRAYVIRQPSRGGLLRSVCVQRPLDSGRGLIFGSDASRAKAASSALGIIQRLDLHNVRGGDALEDELSDAIAALHLESSLGVIEEEDTDVSTVVTIDHAGANIDEVLPRKA